MTASYSCLQLLTAAYSFLQQFISTAYSFLQFTATSYSYIEQDNMCTQFCHHFSHIKIIILTYLSLVTGMIRPLFHAQFKSQKGHKKNEKRKKETCFQPPITAVNGYCGGWISPSTAL